MLKVGDRNRPAGYLEGTGTTELVFGYEVVNGDEDTDGVSIEANSLSLNGGTIKDAAENSAVLDHDGLAADSGHKVDGAGPDLAETGGAVVDGATLTLTFDEPLDRGSTPQASAFRVTGGDTSRTVTDVALSGSAVLLTLDPAVEHGETGIRVSYTVPTGTGVSPLQDVLGNDADRLSNLPVTNETPDTTPPTVSKLEITSDPGTDRTYAAEDDIQVTVTFSETVEVTGTPRLQIELGGGSRTADYQGGSGTAALVFEYEVAEGESDTDGVGVEADSLSGGTIRDEARNNAELDHDGVAADCGPQGGRGQAGAGRKRRGGGGRNDTDTDLLGAPGREFNPGGRGLHGDGRGSGAHGHSGYGERQHGGADPGCRRRAPGGGDPGELHAGDE